MHDPKIAVSNKSNVKILAQTAVGLGNMLNYKLKPDSPITLLLLPLSLASLADFAVVGLGVAGGGVGAGVTGEGVALADLLCLEDLEAVGKLVGRLVGESLPVSSPPPQTNTPDWFWPHS